MFKKSIAIGFLAAMVIGSAATADSYFTCMGSIESQGMLELGEVTSDGDGTVEVFDFRLGERGDSLCTATVNTGANMDVRVNAGAAPLGNVLAILTVNGAVFASHIYGVNVE